MTNLSHRWPAVFSLQSWHAPVCGSQVSECPLHLHGLQLGKSQWPGWHSEQCLPKAPALHGHCPVTGSHWWASEPSRWQSQAKENTMELKNKKDHIIIHLYTNIWWISGRLHTNAAMGSKTICSWCTLVTMTTNYIGFTLTLTSDLFTLNTQWALRITVTSYKGKMDWKKNHQ